ETALLVLGDRALAVDRDAQRVDDTSEQRVADDDGENASGRGDELAFFDLVGLAEHDGADRVLFEVQRETERAAFELEQFVDSCVRKPRDACDAVTDFEHATDLRLFDRGPEPFDVAPKRGSDVLRVDFERRHDYRLSFNCSRRWRTVPSMTVSPMV